MSGSGEAVLCKSVFTCNRILCLSSLCAVAVGYGVLNSRPNSGKSFVILNGVIISCLIDLSIDLPTTKGVVISVESDSGNNDSVIENSVLSANRISFNARVELYGVLNVCPESLNGHVARDLNSCVCIYKLTVNHPACKFLVCGNGKFIIGKSIFACRYLNLRHGALCSVTVKGYGVQGIFPDSRNGYVIGYLNCVACLLGLAVYEPACEVLVCGNGKAVSKKNVISLNDRLGLGCLCSVAICYGVLLNRYAPKRVNSSICLDSKRTLDSIAIGGGCPSEEFGILRSLKSVLGKSEVTCNGSDLSHSSASVVGVKSYGYKIFLRTCSEYSVDSTRIFTCGCYSTVVYTSISACSTNGGNDRVNVTYDTACSALFSVTVDRSVVGTSLNRNGTALRVCKNTCSSGPVVLTTGDSTFVYAVRYSNF